MSQPGVGERIERSPVAQVLIEIGLVVVLLAEVVTHLPDGSAVQHELGKSADWLVRVVAVEQQWGVFAPDPRSRSFRIEGRVTFEDGSTAVWHLPEGARVGANLRYYRWRKWLERVRDDNLSEIWEPTARWIASLYDDWPSPVAEVQLVRMFRDNLLVGEQLPYQEFVYLTYTPDEDDQ